MLYIYRKRVRKTEKEKEERRGKNRLSSWIMIFFRLKPYLISFHMFYAAPNSMPSSVPFSKAWEYKFRTGVTVTRVSH